MTRTQLFEIGFVLDEDVDALNLSGEFLSKGNAFEVTAVSPQTSTPLTLRSFQMILEFGAQIQITST